MGEGGVVGGPLRILAGAGTPTAYSDANGSVIPSETDRQFRWKPITDSD